MTTAVSALMYDHFQNVMLVIPGSQTRILFAGCKTKCKDELCCNNYTVHLDIIKVCTPTDAQVFLKRSIKIYIKTAPTCFGVIIIRECTIWSG